MTTISNSNSVMEIFNDLQAATRHLIKSSDNGDGSIYCGKWREIMHYMSCGKKLHEMKDLKLGRFIKQ